MPFTTARFFSLSAGLTGLAALFFLILPGASLIAQELRPRKVTRLLEVGISANAYRGDLSMKYQKWASAVQVGLKLNFKKRFNSHFNLGVGAVTGQNPDYQFTGVSEIAATPNVFFKTSFISLQYDLQLNLLKTRHWTVYLSQGFGLIRFEPKNERNAALSDAFDSRAEAETYGNIAALLPTQAGIAYAFDNGYGLGLQSGWLNPQTDYLDNISQWGNRAKKDNVLWFRFSFLAPLTFGQ